MEYLAPVHDGSTGEVHAGYWLCDVTGAEVNGSEIVPLYQKLYSAEAKEFLSENAEVLAGIDLVRTHTQGRGIWTVDRGGDRKKLLEPMLGQARSASSSALRGDDSSSTGRMSAGAWPSWARGAGCAIQRGSSRSRTGKRRPTTCATASNRFVWRDARSSYTWWFVAGFGEEPLLLLTNALDGARDSQSLWWIARIYLTRWKIEETFRFIKQSYNLEDIRVMKYQRLKNLVVLVTAAAYFAATFLGQKMKLRILCEKLLIISQRFFGIPPFRFYALADGIKNILSQSSPGPPEEPLPNLQLELLLAWDGLKI